MSSILCDSSVICERYYPITISDMEGISLSTSTAAATELSATISSQVLQLPRPCSPDSNVAENYFEEFFKEYNKSHLADLGSLDEDLYQFLEDVVLVRGIGWKVRNRPPMDTNCEIIFLGTIADMIRKDYRPPPVFSEWMDALTLSEKDTGLNSYQIVKQSAEVIRTAVDEGIEACTQASISRGRLPKHGVEDEQIMDEGIRHDGYRCLEGLRRLVEDLERIEEELAALALLKH